MKDGENAFNIIASIEKHIESLKPLLPKQAIVCIGEYPIKMLLKDPSLSREGTLPIFIEKSSEDIYKWIPKAYQKHFVLGFENSNIDTHFWYNVLPTISKDTSIMDSLKREPNEKIRGAIVFSSVWDGVGSAALPALIGKFRAQNIDSLSIAVLPSKIQPPDAHFNAYSALQMCLATEGATVLLLGRDQLETYEGVDKKGLQIKGNRVVDYMLELFLAKESLVEEISELSRTFNVKLFSAIAITAASYRVYGSLENMQNTALLKPLSTFDLSSATLLYVLLRIPMNLKDKIPRSKIELAITNWFKEKTSLQSIHITEPIYTDDMSDRIDAVLFIGGFDITSMFAEWNKKVESLKRKAVKMGYMTEDWQVLLKVEEKIKAPDPKQMEKPKAVKETVTQAVKAVVTTLSSSESIIKSTPSELETAPEKAKLEKPKRSRSLKKAEPKIKPTPQITQSPEDTQKPKPKEEKRTRRTKKSPEAPPEKPKRARRTKNAQTEGKA